MKKRNAFQRGFTLIELMIVIVILGILMGTILPRLTGAQARARDTARIADMTNLAQALEVYYNDHGQYPDAIPANCLVPLAKTDAGYAAATSTQLGSYMKGGVVPKPGTASLKTAGCTGAYYYAPLKKDGVSNAAYVLASDIETWQQANYHLTDGTLTTATSTYDDISSKIGKVSEEDSTDAARTIYVVIP